MVLGLLLQCRTFLNAEARGLAGLFRGLIATKCSGLLLFVLITTIPKVTDGVVIKRVLTLANGRLVVLFEGLLLSVVRLLAKNIKCLLNATLMLCTAYASPAPLGLKAGQHHLVLLGGAGVVDTTPHPCHDALAASVPVVITAITEMRRDNRVWL